MGLIREKTRGPKSRAMVSLKKSLVIGYVRFSVWWW
jgi:hypothetical protein